MNRRKLLPRSKLTSEQLEAKAVHQMINKAICSLTEKRQTLDWIVYNCHDVKQLRQAYSMRIKALE